MYYLIPHLVQYFFSLKNFVGLRSRKGITGAMRPRGAGGAGSQAMPAGDHFGPAARPATAADGNMKQRTATGRASPCKAPRETSLFVTAEMSSTTLFLIC